jgi:hypothetical protein
MSRVSHQKDAKELSADNTSDYYNKPTTDKVIGNMQSGLQRYREDCTFLIDRGVMQ